MRQDPSTQVYHLILLFERYITYILTRSKPVGIFQTFIIYTDHAEFIWEELRFKKISIALRTIYGMIITTLKRVYNKYEFTR